MNSKKTYSFPSMFSESNLFVNEYDPMSYEYKMTNEIDSFVYNGLVKNVISKHSSERSLRDAFKNEFLYLSLIRPKGDAITPSIALSDIKPPARGDTIYLQNGEIAGIVLYVAETKSDHTHKVVLKPNSGVSHKLQMTVAAYRMTFEKDKNGQEHRQFHLYANYVEKNPYSSDIENYIVWAEIK